MAGGAGVAWVGMGEVRGEIRAMMLCLHDMMAGAGVEAALPRAEMEADLARMEEEMAALMSSPALPEVTATLVGAAAAGLAGVGSGQKFMFTLLLLHFYTFLSFCENLNMMFSDQM